MQRSIKVTIFVLIGLAFSIGPAQAAKLHFGSSSKTVTVGERITVPVILDTEGETVNVADVHILNLSPLRATAVSRARSFIQLWLRSSFSTPDIYFSGGVTGGFNERNGIVGEISFWAQTAGEGKIVFDIDSQVLLHDGNGTPAKLTVQPLSVTVKPLSVSATPTPAPSATPKPTPQVTDTKKPAPFQIVISKDPIIFGGLWHAGFYAKDESGVTHYEVKEGEGEWRVAQSPYLLQDQDLRTVIRVRAWDSFGNYRISVHPNIYVRIWWKIESVFWWLYNLLWRVTESIGNFLRTDIRQLDSIY